MSNHVSVEFSKLITVPPRFGDAVKMSVGGPLMMVVDSDELPPDSAPKSLVTVMYADDMRRVHTIMVPWGLLHAWSPSDESQVADSDVREEEASFLSTRAAVAQADMVARIAVVCDELRKSRDPASFFGLLRSSITELIQSAAAELELPTVAVVPNGGFSPRTSVACVDVRSVPERSGTYAVEPSDDPTARGTHVPPGYSYVSPGVVRSPDGTELSVGVALVNGSPGESSSFVPCGHL